MSVHRFDPSTFARVCAASDDDMLSLLEQRLGKLPEATITISGCWQPCAWEWLVDDWPGQIPADVETHSTHQLAVYTTGLDLHRILCTTCNHEWPL